MRNKPTTAIAERRGIDDDDCLETNERGIAVALNESAFDAKTRFDTSRR